MVPRTLWRVGALVCACLALGALCGFALPVPEDWLARMRARLAARVPDNNDNNTAAAVWLDT